MREFRRLRTAAGYAMRAEIPMFVFEGSEEGYVVATAREARELGEHGLEPLSISETAKAAAHG